jgi:hypothetical protein
MAWKMHCDGPPATDGSGSMTYDGRDVAVLPLALLLCAPMIAAPGATCSPISRPARRDRLSRGPVAAAAAAQRRPGVAACRSAEPTRRRPRLAAGGIDRRGAVGAVAPLGDRLRQALEVAISLDPGAVRPRVNLMLLDERRAAAR